MTPPVSADRPLVTICGWCDGAQERTAAAIAQGYDVSHTICSACSAKFAAQSDAEDNA